MGTKAMILWTGIVLIILSGVLTVGEAIAERMQEVAREKQRQEAEQLLEEYDRKVLNNLNAGKQRPELSDGWEDLVSPATREEIHREQAAGLWD